MHWAGVAKDGNPPWQATLIGVGQKDSANKASDLAVAEKVEDFLLRGILDRAPIDEGRPIRSVSPL